SGKPVDAKTGKSASMIQGVDFHWFPLDNPGIVSIPIAFFLGWLGTVLSTEHNQKKYAEMEVRSLTGVGAEKATQH
ncbi:cation acetate symporter, partial [Amycolatopsis coloradensis]